MTRAYIMYRRQRVNVTIEHVYKGSRGLVANVKAVDGYPFYCTDIESQGESIGASFPMHNGYRLPADLVFVEAE